MEGIAIIDKKPINYLEHYSPWISDIFKKHQKKLISYLKETTYIAAETENYNLLTEHVFPVLTSALRMFQDSKGERLYFVEILTKIIFNPKKKCLPRELNSLLYHLSNLLRRKVEGEFSLAWQPVLDVYETIYSSHKRQGEFISKSSLGSTMHNCGQVMIKLKKFFPKESGNEIYLHLKPYLNFDQKKTEKYFSFLTCLLRTDSDLEPKHYEMWMKELLAMLVPTLSNRVIQASILRLITNLAR